MIRNFCIKWYVIITEYLNDLKEYNAFTIYKKIGSLEKRLIDIEKLSIQNKKILKKIENDLNNKIEK